jgi:hypothetical protein
LVKLNVKLAQQAIHARTLRLGLWFVLKATGQNKDGLNVDLVLQVSTVSLGYLFKHALVVLIPTLVRLIVLQLLPVISKGILQKHQQFALMDGILCLDQLVALFVQLVTNVQTSIKVPQLASREPFKMKLAKLSAISVLWATNAQVRQLLL